MSEAKWTPEKLSEGLYPWCIDIDSTDDKVCEMDAGNPHYRQYRDLFLAAPAMYEALDRLYSAINDIPGPIPSELGEAKRQAVAAIAQATGKEGDV